MLSRQTPAGGSNPAGGGLPRALPLMWLNGKLIATRKAVAGPEAHVIHYGSGCFGGMRSFNGRIFRERDHLERLIYSAAALGFTLPYSIKELGKAIRKLHRLLNVREAYIRPFAFRGEGPLGVKSEGEIKVGLMLMPWGAYFGGKPFRVAATRKVPPMCYPEGFKMARLKWGANYAFTRAAQEAELRPGEEELIFCDWRGFIAECGGANLFIFKDGEVATPKRDAILAGITRDTAIRLLACRGINVTEKDITPEELLRADAVLATGTAAGICPVRRIAPCGRDESISVGTCEMADTLVRDYQQLIQGEHSLSDEMLTSL